MSTIKTLGFGIAALALMAGSAQAGSYGYEQSYEPSYTTTYTYEYQAPVTTYVEPSYTPSYTYEPSYETHSTYVAPSYGHVQTYDTYSSGY